MRVLSVVTCMVMMVMVVVVVVVEGSKILYLAPLGTKSHHQFYTGIINALASRGHQITHVTAFKSAKETPNVREVVLPDADVSQLLPNMFSTKMAGAMYMMQMMPKLCSDKLALPEVQALKEEQFDLIIMSAVADCFLSLTNEIKIPFIYVAPTGVGIPFSTLLGNPGYPSFVVNKFLDYPSDMTFLQRLVNTISSTAADMFYEYYLMPSLESECRRRDLCPHDMPSFNTLRYNASLMFFNSVPTLDHPARPMVPGEVQVGGIHCRPAQPLPQDLEKWVNGSGSEGFIFFSLGSVVKPTTLPEEHRRILVSVFGSLKQRVLWKWDQDTMDDLPPNVRLGKWLPQQDILGHPKLKMFITHGGLLSTLESVYHGVSVLGMPVFADQDSNMRGVERDGWGSVLTWDQLTADAFKEKINFVMSSQEMKQVVTEKSAVMKDQLQHPSELVGYWSEYVIRHQGAYHLRCPIVHMSWVTLYNVDVWAILVLTGMLVIWIDFKILQALCRCLCSLKSKRKLD